MHSRLAELLADLARALDRGRLGWYLFGAQAAILHGASRLTADVDVTVALGERPTQELVALLEDAGFRLRVQDVDEFVARTRVLPFLHDASRMATDVVLAGPGPEELFLARAVVQEVEGVRVPVATAEDIAVMKMLGGRPKDVEDVVAILAAKEEKMDLRYVRDTLGALERALDQADLMPAFERALARAKGR